MSKLKTTQISLLAAAGAAALLASGGGARAQDAAPQASGAAVRAANLPPETTDEKLARLEAQVEELQAALLDLKASSSANFKDVRQAAASQPTVTLANGKPSFTSADGRFQANLRTIIQFDAATYFQKTPGPTNVDLRRGAAAGDTAHARDLNSGDNFRRARLGVDGKVFGDFDYAFILDVGGGSGAEDAGRIQEAWLQYSGWKPWHLKVGAFAPLEGLEDANSTNGMPFLERPAPSDIARSIAGADTRTGVQLWANGDHWLVSGAVTGPLISSINSTGTATAQPFDEQLGFVGRIAATPLYGDGWLIHVGANGSYVEHPADTTGPEAGVATVGTGRYTAQFRERPELRTDGTRLIDTGAIDASHAWSWGLEAAAQYKNFYAQGEYFGFGADRRASTLSNPKFSGWYAEGSWLLTGESRKYNPATAAFDAPSVTNNFNPKEGKWGAWELALRYSSTDLNYHEGVAGAAAPADGIRGGQQDIVTAGLNWYLNPTVRFMLDLQHVKIDRLSPNATTFSTPVGAQIGQTYNALALRSQLAF